VHAHGAALVRRPSVVEIEEAPLHELGQPPGERYPHGALNLLKACPTSYTPT